MKKQLYLNNAQLEAELSRCLNCKNPPCMTACPVHCNPAEFIRITKEGKHQQAADSIFRTNPMGQSCGLVCPEKFCMNACTRSKIDFPINIPKVQATILNNTTPLPILATPNNHKVAIIGAGPAGIASAAKLAENGIYAEIFEATDYVGGALNLIPDYRLPPEVINRDWQNVSKNPLITLRLSYCVDDPSFLLQTGFEAVIIATGEPKITDLGIPGEELAVTYVDHLKYPDKFRTCGNVAVIGGGAVAADCAITAKLNGAGNVEMFVRRKISDMKVTTQERDFLIENAIDITTMTRVKKIYLNPQNNSLNLITAKNHFVDGKLTELENTEICRSGFDLVVKAIGSFADKYDDSERIIYAGDCKIGSSTLVEALASGQQAAQKIIKNLIG